VSPRQKSWASIEEVFSKIPMGASVAGLFSANPIDSWWESSKKYGEKIGFYSSPEFLAVLMSQSRDLPCWECPDFSGCKSINDIVAKRDAENEIFLLSGQPKFAYLK